MKKLFISLIAIGLCATAAVAQQNDPQTPDHAGHRGPGAHDRHAHGQMLANKLHFTDQQRQQVKDINQQYHQQLADLKKNEDITVREYKAKLATLRKDHQQQMQAVLTPDQNAQLQKMKEERRELAKVNAKARAEKMKIKLGLSEEQAKQLRDMRSNTSAKIKEIHSDQSLTPEQKKEQIKTLAQEQKQQLKSVLTPEQLKQLEEMHHRHQREWTK